MHTALTKTLLTVKLDEETERQLAHILAHEIYLMQISYLTWSIVLVTHSKVPLSNKTNYFSNSRANF